MEVEGTLLVLLLILFVGLVVPELFRKLRLPFVTSLILVGAFLGPNGLEVIEPNETIAFFGFLGLTFLMFMAGLETKVEYIKHSMRRVFFLAFVNGFIPGAAGFSIAYLHGYDLFASLVVGAIFISSAVVIIIPSIKSSKLFKKEDGQLIVSTVVLEDILSLVFLGLVLQSVEPITSLPLPVYFIVLVLSVVALKAVIPKLSKLVTKKRFFPHEEYEDQLRFIIVVLMAVLLYFSALGMHPIVAAFLLGLVLSSAVPSHKIIHQLHTIGYGLFVPVFFFLIGTQLDFHMLFSASNGTSFLLLLIVVSIGTKYLSGYWASRAIGISKNHSQMFGVASTIHLTTALAGIQAAYSVDIVDATLLTSMVVLVIVTTIFSPIVLRLLGHA